MSTPPRHPHGGNSPGATRSHCQSFDPRRSGRVWIFALLAIAAVTLLAALLVEAIRKVQESAARTQSINNLKNLAIASHAFHDGHKRILFNGSDKQSPNFSQKYTANHVLNSPTSGSWAFMLIPYTYGLMEAYPRVREIPLTSFLCPGRGRPIMEDGLGTWTDYFLNNYLNDPENAETPDNADVRRNFGDITDGLAYTVIIGHGNISTADYRKTSGVHGSSNVFVGGTFGTARAGQNWRMGEPLQVSLQRDSETAPDLRTGGWGGPFPQGALIAMADCNVRIFSYSMSGQIWAGFLTPTGNEKQDLPDLWRKEPKR